MNDNEVIDHEIDAMCAKPEEEALMLEIEIGIEQANKEIAKTAQVVWDTLIAPTAALMMDGETFVLQKDLPHAYGLDAEVYMATDEGKEAEKLIAAGYFEKGGQLLQFAMNENALENACSYLDLDLDQIRENKNLAD